MPSDNIDIMALVAELRARRNAITKGRHFTHMANDEYHVYQKAVGEYKNALYRNADSILAAIEAQGQLREALRLALPHLHWANTHSDRCDEAIAAVEAALGEKGGQG